MQEWTVEQSSWEWGVEWTVEKKVKVEVNVDIEGFGRIKKKFLMAMVMVWKTVATMIMRILSFLALRSSRGSFKMPWREILPPKKPTQFWRRSCLNGRSTSPAGTVVNCNIYQRQKACHFVVPFLVPSGTSFIQLLKCSEFNRYLPYRNVW